MIFWTVLVILIVWMVIRAMKKPDNFPPGLPKLPIIGSLPFLKPNFRQNISDLHEKYGHIFSLWMGDKPWIVICDFDLYKEAMNKEQFSFRPTLRPIADFMYTDEEHGPAGLIFSNGLEWQEQRRFALRNLRDFGFGKITMESLIIEEVEKMVQLIQRKIETCSDGGGKGISLHLQMNIAVLNALWHLVSGQKMQYDDPNLKQIVNQINQFLVQTNRAGPMFVFPWLKNYIPGLIGYDKLQNTIQQTLQMISKLYQSHVDDYDENCPRDLMDMYIKQINHCQADPSSSFHGQRGTENLLISCLNLFLAGSETTSNTLLYAVFYLAKSPHIQDKLVREIEAQIGRDSWPSLEMKSKTPYAEATINEVLRMSSFAFAGVPRYVSEDTSLAGYVIPKGTGVMSGLYEIMHDKTYWKDPENFRPERFIDPDSGQFKSNERLVAFGYGRRLCLGRTLALNELYLFLVSFVQKFQFSDPDPLDLNPTSSLNNSCPPFTVRITERA